MSLESRLKAIEAVHADLQTQRELVDLTPFVLDAPDDDYIHGAWVRFLLIQPAARGWLMREGASRDDVDRMIAGARCCVVDSMMVSMALSRVPRDVWPDYEPLYQKAELYRQLHWPDETLPERIENA